MRIVNLLLAAGLLCAIMTFASCSEDDDPMTELLPPDNGNSNEEERNEDNKEETPTSDNMNIRIGNRTFTATLSDNAAAEAFKALLPMTVTMNELNGNEKYYYLPDNLPTAASRPGTIHEGDIMLYASGCLVLFYETFSSSYSYTPIGRIDDANGLAEAVGSGSINVTYELSTQE